MRNIHKTSSAYVYFGMRFKHREFISTQVRTIMKFLESNDVTLPNGGRLTVSRWQQLGHEFGMQGEILVSTMLPLAKIRWIIEGGIDRVHRMLLDPSDYIFRTAKSHKTAELVFRATNDLSLFQKIGYKTLQLVQERQPFDANPIYAILHEPIYCQGYVRVCRWYPLPPTLLNIQ